MIILNSNFGIIVITSGLLGFDLVLWYQNWEYVKSVIMNGEGNCGIVEKTNEIYITLYAWEERLPLRWYRKYIFM